MQFHLDGFRTGDPTIEPAAEGAPRVEIPETVDVLIDVPADRRIHLVATPRPSPRPD